MTFSEKTLVVGRFAPSPTGPLHIGSLVAAVGSYCLARRDGGRWLVRMEDLDAPRVVPGAAEDILRTLEAFGLCWDGAVLWQSRRTAVYEEALEALKAKGLVFDCACSRREILASAPHVGEEGGIYPGTCREGLPRGRRPRALRLRVPATTLCFNDGVSGLQEQHLSTAVGDFILRRADGLFAYQLAVVVDDHACGVNQVVRGADLLGSTPRQIYLHECLGHAPPLYYHLPLALGEDGEKISKRHGPVSIGCGEKPAPLLCRVLEFLGQQVPPDLAQESPGVVLEWAVRHFDPALIPVAPGFFAPERRDG
ncbi:glutamyl-Q tRNA(Asp) synthetase [Geoalkalibacter ferrihydriticus]|uniref:Glutamyl-Q tRNA(Asp) synthetase n=2 Tax=Geoalkalibacter ferrihydriticus TaxID=392333 RepID=A0A0C2HT20_9BACT|nr:tRNA glutamyl-Q(34) synthetase GluQRS [Geoalkalibacter ferrihydriticus]KIH75937.1 glutamyl-Q tRNA(Asp) ligase [Geoalkalibacter ferrihydriticus DSM 17813]SDM56189.1 glutamyl-Q tRNA(Asp) synthetase [Geoalkalibacter ferrihydriticus]